MKRFFYIDDSGKRKGPYTIEQLKEHYLFENTLVWTDGLEKWTAAGRVHLLQDIIHKPPPPLDLIDTGEIETVKIGTQVWMKRNLDVSHFRNGESIPEAKTDNEWIKAGEEGKPAWCFYDNDPEMGQQYGKLYNWFVVNDPRGLAPKGWHVPGDNEWTRLVAYVESLGHPDSIDGFDKVGFSALPGGYRLTGGSFYRIGDYGSWWSSTEYSSTLAWHRGMGNYGGYVYRNGNSKTYGFSARCLRE